ncbi:unnamed protein product [Mycena citricolor]|uniref:FAD-binding domain-containing protein n=1 Tax=Mycena citricolor TaxID=2018698 RepID=A0AAD2Q1I7_9AGAR|nr:unnamed protein product [Mycena citricolor]
MSSQHTAQLQIQFLVVGGGVAGLACAYALAIAGHEVTIIEKGALDAKTEGSVRCPPNMTRLLKRWPGMAALFDERATPVSGLSFRDGQTGVPIGFMRFYEELMSDLRADFLALKHDDLRRHLDFLCASSGQVRFVHGHVVGLSKESVDDGVSVSLQDGRILSGDIIVGADGHQSVVRKLFFDEREPSDVVVTWQVHLVIPTQAVLDRGLANEHEFTIWAGDNSMMSGILDTASKNFYLGICTTGPVAALNCDWFKSYDNTFLPDFDLAGYDPRIHELIDCATDCHPTIQTIHENRDAVAPNSKVILIGDAANSVLLHGTHNTSMAIEDAMTLGSLFSRVRTREKIKKAIGVYDDLREPRVEQIRKSEYASLKEISLPQGVERQRRDDALQLTLQPEYATYEDCSDSDDLIEAWEPYIDAFKYDAVEAVDDWFSQLGSFFENVPPYINIVVA